MRHAYPTAGDLRDSSYRRVTDRPASLAYDVPHGQAAMQHIQLRSLALSDVAGFSRTSSDN
jgi:hypothetical protein